MNSALLDVGIGLAFVFLLTSIVCSGLQELVGGWIDLRGRMLVRGMESMLELPDVPSTTGTPAVPVPPAAPAQPDAWFEQALRGLVRGLRWMLEMLKIPIVGTAPKGLARAVMDHPMVKSLRDGSRRPSYIEGRTFALALTDVLATQYRSGQWLFDDLARTAAAVPDGDLKKRLDLIVREARGDSDRARGLIEQWYGETMDRVSGWYNRQTKLILIGLGFAVAGLLNIDALHIANRLSSDAALRQALVASADNYVAAHPVAPAASSVKEADASAKQVRAAVQQIVDLKLPVGYGADWDAGRAGQGCLMYLWMICGWAITALAVSIGAPMWFDILSKLLSLRAAGAKPATNEAPTAGLKAGQPDGSSGAAVAALATGTAGLGWAAADSPTASFAAALNPFEAEFLSRSDVRSLQEALGVESTGLLNQVTRDAIGAAQRARGLPPSGQLDAELVQLLVAK